jgi:hypothetical protein
MQSAVIEWTELTSQSKSDHFFEFLNGTDYRVLKKRTESGDRGGSWKNRSSISHRLCQSPRQWLKFVTDVKWPFTKYPETCIFLSMPDQRVMPPDI